MNKGIRFFPGLWLLLLFISIGLLIFFFAPANSSIVNVFGPTPIATQENLWAFAEIHKPTYTPAPVIPTAIPTTEPVLPAPTETPGSMVMEIVDNASGPANGAPANISRPAYSGSKYILVDISE